MNYVDGFVTAVPTKNKQKYLDHAKEALIMFKEYGALRMVENWGDDVPKGKITDFYRAVNAQEEETIVMSWIEWPNKEIRDAGMEKMMSDPRMENMDMPFDGKRLIYGGFQTILAE